MRRGWVWFTLSLLILGCTQPNSGTRDSGTRDSGTRDSGQVADASVTDAATSAALEPGSTSGVDAQPNVGSSSPMASTPALLDAGVVASDGSTSVPGDAAEQQEDASLDGALAASSSTLPSGPSAAPSRHDPFSLPEKCTSGQYWTEGSGETMRPGEACIACHERENRGPVLTFAGTVYARGHEPDDCLGVLPADGIVVEITDAANQVFKLNTNAAGNFLRSASVVLPYTARVLSIQGERRMLTPQTNGDCNSCHTSSGNSGAPGRIAVP
jgi:hypothetical protein